MKLTLSYYPDINQYKSLEEIRNAVVNFSKILEQDYSNRIGQDVVIEVLDIMSVKEQTHQMTCGNTSIGLMKPVSYVLSHNKNKDIVPAAVAWRIIDGVEGETYFAQIYTRANTNIESLKDIKGIHRLGFGDSFSTSNFLIPAADLLKSGVNPLTKFRKIEFFGGHDNVAKAVYLNETDVGAGHDGVIHLLSLVKGYEDANQVLKRIKKVDIHSDPIVINKAQIPDYEKFCESLFEISKLREVKSLLEDFWGNVTKLGPTKHENYQSIEEAIAQLNLTESDILN